MPDRSYRGQLQPLRPEEIALKNALQQDVKKLAVEIGMRNYDRYAQLNSAKDFLATSLTQVGYEVKQQEYKISRESYFNLEVERKGTKKPDEIILVGGHYDSVFGSPGANDNGTGAAATLELARLFSNKSHSRTIRFVEFTNEEPPFFWTENMGSLVYAKGLRDRNENVIAMLSLETMGYFSEVEGSQKYPFPIGLLYPSQGNFIGFIGNLGSGSLVRKAIASFRHHAQFPSEGAALPDWIPGVGWSDHWAFWQQGYQGIMVTDTAPFRYTHYHTKQDTLDKIDFEKLARIVSGLAGVISDLAE
ncbi:M28 family peptidase [Tumidithrix elongata RA019]|uniref:M28 family peptidase n=2 Tax=Tumidithrix TaxID=3088355 RepID=A0AAW9Q1D3_9CYAN|nr:M28 family peptidase [Tumidithrix elongata RA019]